MSMEHDLRALVLSSSAVSTLIGTRYSVAALPQGGGAPSIFAIKVSGTVDYHMRGESGIDTDLVQLDLRSTTSMAEAMSLRDAVMAVLSGYSGTVGSTEFYGVFLRQERQSIAQAEGGGMGYLIQLDFDISSRQSA